MRYEFPWPPRSLSPNVSVHWRTLGKAKARYKEDCEWVIWESRVRAESHESCSPPVTAQVTFVCDRRRRDPDNHMAMLKPLWDALVEMGVLVGDHAEVLTILAPKWELGRKNVIVELSPYQNGGE